MGLASERRDRRRGNRAGWAGTDSADDYFPMEDGAGTTCKPLNAGIAALEQRDPPPVARWDGESVEAFVSRMVPGRFGGTGRSTGYFQSRSQALDGCADTARAC